MVAVLTGLWRKRWRWLFVLGAIAYVLFPLVVIAFQIRNDWLAKEPEEWYDWPRVLDIGLPFTDLAVGVNVVVVPILVAVFIVRGIRRFRRRRQGT